MTRRPGAIPAIWRAQLRLTTAHPLVTGLHIAAVALAVAVLFATAITRHSSSTSLALANRGLAGGHHAQLAAPGGIGVEQYAELRRRWLQWNLQLHPVLEGRATVDGRPFAVTGIDPLATPALAALAPLLAGRQAAILHYRDAAHLAVGVGDRLEVTAGRRTRPVLIGGLSENAALAGRILVDIATAGRLLDRSPSVLDRIEIRFPDRIDSPATFQPDGPPGISSQWIERLQPDLDALPPPKPAWISSGRQLAGQRQLIEAFEFNLQALSMLALLVAGLLLASVAQFSFRHRRPLLQRLRELGVAPAQLWRMTLLETVLLAAAGSVIGWVLGGLLSLALLPLVAASIETLYDTGPLLRFPPDPWSYLWPAVLSALVLTGVQSWQLWRWQRPAMTAGWRRGLAVAAALAAGFSLQGSGLEGAYIAVSATAACALLVLPDGLRWILRPGSRLHWRRAPLLRLGWRDAARLPPHLALATAALCLALAASLAVSLMAGSLRLAIQDWLVQQFSADLYLTLPDPGRASYQYAYWARQPGVEQVSIRLRHDWPVGGQRATIEGINAPAAGGLPLLDCPDACLETWRNGALLVSEPLARRLQLSPGDPLVIDGVGNWTVAGILRDFDPGGGRLVLPLTHYRQAGLPARQASLGLWLDAAADRQALYQNAQQAGLQMVDPAQLRHSVDALFARTFAVTDWLRLAVLVIALLAVAAGLSLQALHHQAQLAVLRALGATPTAASGWLAIQAIATAIGAALWAVPLGYAMAWLLVHQVNPRAFGWTLTLQPQPETALAMIPLALLAALASLPYPCWQLFRPSGLYRTGLLAVALSLAGCGTGSSDPPVWPMQALPAPPAQAFAQALQPRIFSFPEDHGPHPQFRDEWWYATGNIRDEHQRRYGFQLTLFRRALRPEAGVEGAGWPPADQTATDQANQGQAYMAHFALTDVAGGRFLYDQRFGSPMAGIAGSSDTPPGVWLDDWRLEWRRDHWQLHAGHGGWRLDLQLTPSGPPVLQGDAGLSRKNAMPGNASYYYSQPRLQAEGKLYRRLDCRSPPSPVELPTVAPPAGRTASAGFASCAGPHMNTVSGWAWLDREWGSSELAPEQQGWDWFALQLEDGRSLMLYQLRERSGEASDFSAGTLVSANGDVTRLQADHFSLHPLRTWRSPDGASIPVQWQLRIAGQDIRWRVVAVRPDQYLQGNFSYWEGAVDVLDDSGVIGSGYLEMTGYGPGH